MFIFLYGASVCALFYVVSLLPVADKSDLFGFLHRLPEDSIDWNLYCCVGHSIPSAYLLFLPPIRLSRRLSSIFSRSSAVSLAFSISSMMASCLVRFSNTSLLTNSCLGARGICVDAYLLYRFKRQKPRRTGGVGENRTHVAD